MRAVDRLDAQGLQVVQACLRAAVDGPFFDDDEFHTLIGFERAEIAGFLATWPDAASTDDQEAAVNNAINMLLGYRHGRWSQWGLYSSASPEELAQVLTRWRGDSGHDASKRGTFDRLR